MKPVDIKKKLAYFFLIENGDFTLAIAFKQGL